MSIVRITRLAALPCLLLMSPLSADERERPSGESWSIAVIPDTQYYVRSAEDAPLFTEVTRWLVEHREEYGIELVLHEGDIVCGVGPGNHAKHWAKEVAFLERSRGENAGKRTPLEVQTREDARMSKPLAIGREIWHSLTSESARTNFGRTTETDGSPSPHLCRFALPRLSNARFSGPTRMARD